MSYQLVPVKVRDISFGLLAEQHRVDLNWRYREGWESLRGTTIVIKVPSLGEDQRCNIGGRVFLCVGLFCRSMCEHQLEIGD